VNISTSSSSAFFISSLLGARSRASARFCENGSLHAICKRFGKFPENLVAVYISQVLNGLVYLHDQGVIHRDIKGANLLTNKDGTVKLADFGVASTAAAGMNDAAVVGSPYWSVSSIRMCAVILTVVQWLPRSSSNQERRRPRTYGKTLSFLLIAVLPDLFRSVGATVIELLEGKPPFHFLDPMPALFRIVQDDCPPIPEGASAVVKDFLYHCFQKDPNLRVSAKKLLKHPWMAQARRQLGKMEADEEVPRVATNGRPRSNYNYDDAVKQVEEWNEALKCTNGLPPRGSPTYLILAPTKGNRNVQRRPNSMVDTGPPSPSPIPRSGSSGGLSASTSTGSAGSAGTILASSSSAWRLNIPPTAAPTSALAGVPRLVEKPAVLAMAPEEQDDNWDDDFEEGISLNKLHGAAYDQSRLHWQILTSIQRSKRRRQRTRRRTSSRTMEGRFERPEALRISLSNCLARCRTRSQRWTPSSRTIRIWPWMRTTVSCRTRSPSSE
jgi:serine/threonine protein kinase